jgi:hypothetical protein
MESSYVETTHFESQPIVHSLASIWSPLSIIAFFPVEVLTLEASLLQGRIPPRQMQLLSNPL